MKRIAIRRQGSIIVLDNYDELVELKKRGIVFDVLGYVCDLQEFGDSCSTLCYFYRKGNCKSRVIKDNKGNLWHLSWILVWM